MRRPKVVIVLLTAALMLPLLVTFSPAEEGVAHSGDVVWSGWTPYPPTIDGVFDPDEWANAYELSITLIGKASFDAVIYVMNDKDDMYICIKVYDTSPEGGDYVRIYFDEFHDGVLTNGDEDMKMIWASNNIFDYYWKPGWRHESEENFYAAVGWAGDHWVFEVEMPLCSPDEHDLCVEPGSTVGFYIMYDDWAKPSPGYSAGWPERDAEVDPTRWADLVLSAEGVWPVLSVDLSYSPAPAVADHYFTICCVIENEGTARALDVVAFITAPPNVLLAPGMAPTVKVGDLEDGHTAMVVWALKVASEGTYSFIVNITSTNADPVSRVVDVEVVGAPTGVPPIISMNTAVSPSTIERGETFTLLCTVSNLGEKDAEDVRLVLSLPTGLSLATGEATITIGTLGVGESRSVSWTVRGDEAGAYIISVKVQSTNALFSDEDLVAVVVKGLRVNAGLSATSVVRGEEVTLSVSVSNELGTPISGATVTASYAGASVVCEEVQPGIYETTIDTEGLEGTVAITIRVEKDGYAPYETTISLKVRPPGLIPGLELPLSPTLIIGGVALLAIIAIVAMALRRRG